MDHGDMSMPGHGEMQCSMSMVWNTSTKGMCVVFSSWKVTGPQSLAMTLFALFLLSMLLEYIRLCIRTLEAQLITTHHLTNGIFPALGGGSNHQSHRRKASIQQKRHPSQVVGSSIISSGISNTIGDRRVPQTDSSGSSWVASDDDAPLLPGPHVARDSRSTPLLYRLKCGLV